MSNEIAQFEVQRHEHLTLAQKANEMVQSMETDVQYNAVSEFYIKIKEARRVWGLKIKPVVQAAHIAHKKMKDLQNEIDAPLARAMDDILDPAMTRYSQAKEDKRRKEQERINKALAVEAEKKRKDEADKAEKERLILPSSVIQPTQEPEPPVIVPSIVLEKDKEPEGISYYNTYGAVVDNIRTLCQAVIDGKAPIGAVMPDQPFINQRARMLKDAMHWPGVRLVVTKNIRTTARR